MNKNINTLNAMKSAFADYNNAGDTLDKIDAVDDMRDHEQELRDSETLTQEQTGFLSEIAMRINSYRRNTTEDLKFRIEQQFDELITMIKAA